MTTSRHILSSFEAGLQSLRDSVLMMASLTERNVENARKGLFERDEDWANTAIADDEEIDTLEIQVDREGIELMLRFHPVASDMRNVIAAMKMCVNLERIADQAVNIARRSRKLNLLPPLPVISELEPMYSHCTSMLQDAVKAYADNNLDKARTLKTRDKELDQLNREFSSMITDLMPQSPDLIPSYMDLIFISRFIERIGDQSTNIAEDTIFAVSAEDIRHIVKAVES